MSRRSDDGDWKANVIPGHRATPRSIKVLLGVTAFVIQTALGLILTENLSLFLNRLTLTVAGATALVVPLLLWIAMDLGRGIERQRLRERDDRRERSDEERPLTPRQQLAVERIVSRRLQQAKSRSDRLDGRSTDADRPDPGKHEQAEERPTERRRVRRFQTTEEELREIVAGSLDTPADSRQARQIADEIWSRLGETGSRTDGSRADSGPPGEPDEEADPTDPAPTRRSEQGGKSKEGGSRTWDRETDEREPEFRE